MAVAAITAVDRSHATIDRSQSERDRLDKLHKGRLIAEAAKAKQLAQDKQAELDRLKKAEADKELKRRQAAKDAERERVEHAQTELDARRVEARRQADLDRLDRLDAGQEAQRVLQSQTERARFAGLNAYRAQVLPPSSISA